MASERAERANRRNARASTGPRTAAGKARSGQNARKHGLSAARPDLLDGGEVERIVGALLLGTAPGPDLRAAARAVAEAQVHLTRVRACRRVLLASGAPAELERATAAPVLAGAITPERFQALERLERYVGRALSRRRTAIRRFTALADAADTAGQPSSPVGPS